jgi:hypothetical protein
MAGPEGYSSTWDDVDPVMGHYGPDGEAISLRSWCRLREFRPELVRIAEDTIGDYWVSTVWLGIDHGLRLTELPEYRPMIFETMVFKGQQSDLDCRRYSTEEEALQGHRRVCDEVQLLLAGTTPVA